MEFTLPETSWVDEASGDVTKELPLEHRDDSYYTFHGERVNRVRRVKKLDGHSVGFVDGQYAMHVLNLQYNSKTTVSLCIGNATIQGPINYRIYDSSGEFVAVSDSTEATTHLIHTPTEQFTMLQETGIPRQIDTGLFRAEDTQILFQNGGFRQLDATEDHSDSSDDSSVHDFYADPVPPEKDMRDERNGNFDELVSDIRQSSKHPDISSRADAITWLKKGYEGDAGKIPDTDLRERMREKFEQEGTQKENEHRDDDAERNGSYTHSDEKEVDLE